MSEIAEGFDPAVPVPLSTEGAARRAALLPLLETAMSARARRRRLARMGTGGVAIAVVAAGAVWFTRGAIPSPRHEVAMTTPDRPAGPRLTMRYASFRVVETQAIDATPPALPSVVVEIDDERLLRELREMGRPTGLIRTRGDVVLTADIGLTPVASEKTPGQG